MTQEGITDRKDLPEAVATLFNNASSNIITPDGKVQIIYYDESNYTDMYIATYDPATDAVSEGIKFSRHLTNGGYYNMVPETVTSCTMPIVTACSVIMCRHRNRSRS